MNYSEQEEQVFVEKMPKQWARELFSGARLGDKRRNDRLVEVAANMVNSPGDSFAQSCNGDEAQLEATYRLLGNDAVDYREIIESGRRSARRWLESVDGDVLAVSDTSTLGYEHRLKEELGDLGGSKVERRRGLFVHSVLLLSALTGESLGLGDQLYWLRADADRGKRNKRREIVYELKESFKWEFCIDRVVECYPEFLKRLIFVSDRESDIYELMLYLHGHDLRHIIRASWNRRLKDHEKNLFDQARLGKELGEVMLKVPQRGGRVSRWANVRVRSCTVTLSAPPRPDGVMPPLEVNVVYAEERAAQDPMVWLLLTTEPVETMEQACRVLRCYGLRWKVEDFHKCWKSGGTNVEGLRLQSLGALLRSAAILAFVAHRFMQLRDEGDPWPSRGESQMFISVDKSRPLSISHSPPEKQESPPLPPAPERLCTEVLTTAEWKILWLTREGNRPLPRKAPSRLWAYHALGRLGGWTDTKRTGRVGLKAFWRGYTTLQERVEAVTLVQRSGISIENGM